MKLIELVKESNYCYVCLKKVRRFIRYEYDVLHYTDICQDCLKEGLELIHMEDILQND